MEAQDTPTNLSKHFWKILVKVISRVSFLLHFFSLQRNTLISRFVFFSVLMDREVLFPLNFNGSMNVCLINHADELIEALPMYEKLIEKSGLQGQVLVPGGGSSGQSSNTGNGNNAADLQSGGGGSQQQQQLTRSSVEKCFQTIIDIHYKPFLGKLIMGEELNSPITLSPPPTKFRQVKEFEVIEADIDEVIEVKGFFTLADVASPPVVSRHLILPSTSNSLSQVHYWYCFRCCKLNLFKHLIEKLYLWRCSNDQY